MEESNATNHLKILLGPLYQLNEDEWFEMSSIWKSFSCKRKEVLTSPGEKEKYLYLVMEGVQRVYYFDEENREATLVFTFAPSFGGVIDSLMLQTPSKYYYEALTPSVFLRASFADLEQLMNTRSSVNTLFRKGISQAMSGVLERLVELQCYSSEEKFKKLFKRSPHLLQLVPHKYLANYIGIDPTNFSKLINRINI